MTILRPDLPPFRSAAPRVTLTKAFSTPFANTVATARTCYSGKGVVFDDQVGTNPAALAESLYRAGHHTTYEHAHFQFALENVSRQFLWGFLHAHPFYDSEQVSQRYVAVRPDAFVIPPLEGEALVIYERALARQIEAYERLRAALRPLVEREYYKRFKPSERMARRQAQAIERKCQEAARYVTPIAAHAFLYHTVNAITLLRYWRLCRQGDCPTEQEWVVGQMIERLLEHDPGYEAVLEEPLPRGAFPAIDPAIPRNPKRFREEFDASLGGHTSRLIDYTARGEEALADAVREVLGLPREALSDDEAIRLAHDPARNRLFGEAMNLATLDKVSRTLIHSTYTFRKKLSHAADSQNQRHRMTPASRPLLALHVDDEPDYVTPSLVAEDDAIRRDYAQCMEEAWEAIARLRRLGVADEFALYLLPNAAAVRFTESCDLLNLRHKHRMRLCYNAQEEIWRASLEEALQIRAVHPRIGAWLLPPCSHRFAAGAKPICPEGPRYCGIPVWKLDLEEYERLI
ncbi:MAG: FAD-dependent thymidylate synthase [Candidatus Sumerlaeota bacterium]|nr:FAD-dependent thymidylate synthase [Candidatus Sumerlaeota bacterium]